VSTTQTAMRLADDGCREHPRSVVLATSSNLRGGVWRHIEDLAVRLADTGIDVRVGLGVDAEVLHEACRAAGLRWEPLAQSARADADIWHLHLSDTFNADAVRLLALRRTVGRTLVTEHLPRSVASDPRLEPHIARHRGAHAAKTAFKRAEFSLTSRVIAVSRGSANFLSERYGLKSDKVTIVPNGIAVPDAIPVAALELDRCRIRVAAVGSLIRQKGHDVLIDAALRSSGRWTVTIIGSGAHYESFVARAAAIPDGRVRLAGWLDDPRAELARASVVCIPSRWEAFPYVALEAAAMGLPIVATAVDGLEEIVVDGVTGLLVAPDDAQGLAAALDDLAARPADELRRMGAAGRARVAARFGIERMVSGTLAAYQRAMPARSASNGLRLR
jgi:glycosyltransferase involved in cell wall biosynthesis